MKKSFDGHFATQGQTLNRHPRPMHIPHWLFIVALAIAAIGFLFHTVRQFTPPADALGAQDNGPFVAEVWLEWPICRGSTLYRQRFKDEVSAAKAVKIAAERLDYLLPKYYYDTGWSGERVRYEHEYGIYFGVRAATAEEPTQSIWSPNLPGQRTFTGEHSSAHPLELQRQLAGYRT